MKYLFLAYEDEKRLEAMPAGERDAFENECRASAEMLRQSGHLLAMEGLQGSRSAAAVRVRNGEVSVAGGPFVETNAPPTGLYFINARDLNEAIRVASKMPQARGGLIEVRPMLEFDKR